MQDRIVAVGFFTIALALAGGAAILALFAFIEWLSSGSWPTSSLLQALYDAHLLRARWLISVDWGWRVQEILAHIPLTLALLVAALFSWIVGLWLARR